MPDGMQIVRGYERPQVDRPKAVVRLAKSDIVDVQVQWVGDGGANNLHSHTGNDGFWLVLAGRARFHGDGDELVAELGPHEAVLVPRGTRYWFESAGEDELEILHVKAKALGEKDRRIDHRDRAGVSIAAGASD
jgi:mannose-6-phosphate isomerase-like protein (cupin superfamily)